MLSKFLWSKILEIITASFIYQWLNKKIIFSNIIITLFQLCGIELIVQFVKKSIQHNTGIHNK